jgi:hypothetical protein
MAQLVPNEVKTVNEGFVKCFELRDCKNKGHEVETCPRDLKGWNNPRPPPDPGRLPLVASVGTVRARLDGGPAMMRRSVC